MTPASSTSTVIAENWVIALKVWSPTRNRRKVLARAASRSTRTRFLSATVASIIAVIPNLSAVSFLENRG